MAVRQWTKGMKGGTVGVERPGKGISYTLKAGPGLPWPNHSESPLGSVGVTPAGGRHVALESFK